jgi:hypothetical protein
MAIVIGDDVVVGAMPGIESGLPQAAVNTPAAATATRARVIVNMESVFP